MINSDFLSSYIKKERQAKPILIMAHLVLGYPDFKTNHEQVDVMVKAGADIIEMQIPFSEPIADGPVIAKANQLSLARGTKIQECLDFAQKVTTRHPKKAFIFMSYVNILFMRGIANIISQSEKAGIKGWIVPDLPPEEADVYLAECAKHKISPIFIYAPTHSLARLKTLANYSKGMIYAVARKGITGGKTNFNQELIERLTIYRKIAKKPLAVGFGISQAEDVDFLIGKADIVVIGSKLIEVLDEGGLTALDLFLRKIRGNH